MYWVLLPGIQFFLCQSTRSPPALPLAQPVVGLSGLFQPVGNEFGGSVVLPIFERCVCLSLLCCFWVVLILPCLAQGFTASTTSPSSVCALAAVAASTAAIGAVVVVAAALMTPVVAFARSVDGKRPGDGGTGGAGAAHRHGGGRIPIFLLLGGRNKVEDLFGGDLCRDKVEDLFDGDALACVAAVGSSHAATGANAATAMHRAGFSWPLRCQ